MQIVRPLPGAVRAFTDIQGRVGVVPYDEHRQLLVESDRQHLEHTEQTKERDLDVQLG